MVAEVIDGSLSLMPRPKPRHANAAGLLSGDLHGPFRRGRGGPGGWVFLPEPELHLGPRPDIVVPDLAGWRRERVTEALDRGKKRRIYRREGVKHYWIVDPRIQTLEVFRLEGGRWVEVDTWEGEALVRAEPFDAIELELGAIWKL
jgi:Uma2 family endonuclease